MWHVYKGHGKTEAVVPWHLQPFWCHYVFMLFLPSFLPFW